MGVLTGDKFGGAIRFNYDFPKSLVKRLYCRWPTSKTARPPFCLFITSLDECDVVQKSVEACLLHSCVSLTMDQRCAYWFALHQCRLTATNAIRLQMNTRSIQKAFRLPHHIDIGTTEKWCARMALLCQAWFSRRRSSEPMMKRTCNTWLVLSTLESYEWVHSIFSSGILSNKECIWSACSPDGIAIIRYPDDTFNSGEVTKVTFGGNDWPVAIMEIKRRYQANVYAPICPKLEDNLKYCR